MSFIKELSRRNVFRVMLTYAVAAWLLVEGMDLLTDVFEAPAWVMKVFIGAVVLGFIPAAVFSWIYEITPDGIKKEAEDNPPHSAASAHRLNIAVVVMLAIAIGVFLLKGGEDSTAVTQGDGPPMLAVLPFVSANLTGDSEFFAVGVHDDLLTQLAQLNAIRVISRTSVLEYKDTVRNIREIGRELGADAILEGGVQSAGDRIRINAQLIDAHTDEHLWAETYDRELTAANIFDVQTDIARAITNALKATLTEQDEGRLAAIPTENMAAYRAYHEAMETWRDPPGSGWIKKTQDLLEQAVALDPTFTRAWAGLVGILAFENFGGVKNPDATPRAEEGLEVLRQLAPGSVDHLVGQAFYAYYTLKDYDLAFDYIVEAQALRPSDIKLLNLKSWIQRRQGNFEERTATLRLVRQLDPRDEGAAFALISHLLMLHHYDEAAAELATTDFDNLWFQYTRRLLDYREHKDVDRFASEIIAVASGFEDRDGAYVQIEGYLTARDYDAATQFRDSGRLLELDGGHDNNLQNSMILGILIAYFRSEHDNLDVALAEARVANEKNRNDDGSVKNPAVYLDMALVAAASGDQEVTERLVRRWENVEVDKADRIFERVFACQTLGMAGASQAAVDCLRASFTQPSASYAFLEPYLPWYDSIRESPEFKALLIEFGQ